MSFGGSEFAGETAINSTFTGANVVYFASAGDSPGVEYPSASPNVIGVGGTTISRNQNTGAFQSEVVWNNSPDDFIFGLTASPPGTGGGPSAFESIPTYQSVVSAVVGSHRGVPDLAAVADIASGVWVFNTPTFGGWNFVGGTSVASPLEAAIVNRSGFVWKNSFAALTNIYALSGLGKLTTYFTNVNGGVCGAGATAAFPNGFGEGIDPAFSESAAGINYTDRVKTRLAFDRFEGLIADECDFHGFAARRARDCAAVTGRSSRDRPFWAQWRWFSPRNGVHQLFRAEDVERPSHVVGERRQAEFGADLVETARQERASIHPLLDRAEGMFDDFPASREYVRALTQARCHAVESILVFEA